MQLKMSKVENTFKFDMKKMRKRLEEENEYIMDLLTTFDVPDAVDDANLSDLYLMDGKEVKKLENGTNSRAQTAEELEDRLNIIKNKMRAKKTKTSERAMKRRENKKLKKNKEVKKILISAQKAMQNESMKVSKSEKKSSENGETPQVPKPKPVFNEEGKIVFSKFDFASHPGAKVKKSKKEKSIKNPKLLLKKLKETDKHLKELKEQGEEEKVQEIKNDMAWQKAFDKVEGKKVKDDPKLLVKAIKKKKITKQKSKKAWKERNQKVQDGIAAKQKKRQDNIEKRQKDNKNRKLKKMSKKGRVIPGF